MYVLLTGQAPFDGEEDDDIIKNVSKGVYQTDIHEYKQLSHDAKDLIAKLLTKDVDKRITCEKALEHKWFKSAEYLSKCVVNKVDKEYALQLLNNMENYDVDNMLKCAVIAYLVHNNQHLEPCIQASKLFNYIDINHDGKIVPEELTKGLKEYWNLSDNEAKTKAQKVFDTLDTDRNDYIEHEEFVRAAVDPKIFIKPNYLKFAFNYFDENLSGKISFEEIKKKFAQNNINRNEMIDSELTKIFNKIGIDKNTEINFDIFSKIMKNIINDK